MFTFLINSIFNFIDTIHKCTIEAINDAHKGFITTIIGTGISSLPTYICAFIGLTPTTTIMTLQQIGLIITILLGVVSLIKNLWDLLDKIRIKFKLKKRNKK